MLAQVGIRVLGCDGSGAISGIIAGINKVVELCVKGRKCVANMSLGSIGGYSISLDTAVAGAVSKGVVVVVAAMNANVDACNTSPARAATAFTVGATTNLDARASYSNFGSCERIVGLSVSTVVLMLVKMIVSQQQVEIADVCKTRKWCNRRGGNSGG